MSQLRHIFSTLLSMVLLSSCFTGIESTPTITEREVRRQQPKSTTEDSYLKEIEAMPSNLFIGSKLAITDPKIRIIFEQKPDMQPLNLGDTLTLTSIEETTSFDGQKLALLNFTGTKCANYTYRLSVSPTEFKLNPDISIPFTVNLNKVDAVREKMLGNKYYILTASHYDSTDNVVTGRKFIPVTVNKVVAGNEYYPIRLELTDDNGKHIRIYMSVDAESIMPRRFTTLFSLTDPHLRYPNITNEIWELITNGRVMQGMTTDECRLSLGMPDNIDRRPGYSMIHEIWTYNNGRMLIFEDGILQSFRQ